MQIQLYSAYKKRENSTKTPLVSDATRTVTGYLREPCSIMNPVFKIERFASDASPQSFNYAYVGEFSRWYFVKDWTWVEGLWQCSMTVDVLSSFKTEIGNTHAYVERSSSDFDEYLNDTFYTTGNYITMVTTSLSTSWYGVAPSGGCYVLGIICNANRSSSQLGGAVTYYVMTPSQMGSLMHYLLGTGFLDDNGFPAQMTATQQLAQDTAKALINPIQYIASCMWFPFPASNISDGQNHEIVIGFFDVDSNIATGAYLTGQAITMEVTGTIPEHPQAIGFGKYMNFSPYTRHTIYLPPFGVFPLDPAFTKYGSYLLGRAYCDTITGKATLQISVYDNSGHTGSGLVAYETSSMMGIPIQLAQMTPDYLNAIGSVLKLATGFDSILAGNLSAGSAVTTITSGIGNTLDSLMPQIERAGVTGSFLAEIIPPKIVSQFIPQVDHEPYEFGRPLCQRVQINTLTDFIKCKDVEADIPGFYEEKQKIVNYMTTGFFWE